MQPEPVPPSTIVSQKVVRCLLQSIETRSTNATKSPRSGRGMSIARPYGEAPPQNSACPVTYCTGSPSDSRRIFS